MTKDNIVLDTCVGLTALQLFVKNNNMPVGMVTVRHQIFSELIVQMRDSTDMSLKDRMRDANNVFRYCFNNIHTIEEGNGKKVYESPLLGTDADGNPYHYTSDNGIECMVVSPRLAEMIYNEAQVMEINPANVIAACEDLISCGRMYQELTIDAAKTMYDVNIPYGEDMIHCHMFINDNSEEDLNAKCAWKYVFGNDQDRRNMKMRMAEQMVNGKVNPKAWRLFDDSISYVLNNSQSGVVRKKINNKFIDVVNVSDFQHTMRKAMLTLGLEFGRDMVNIRQEYDMNVMAEMNKVISKPNVRQAMDIVRFSHDVYRSVMSFRSRAIAQARATYTAGSAALEEHVKNIKADAKVALKSLSNQLRLQFKKFKVNDREAVLTMICQVINEGTNSSYAHNILEEEFFKFVFSLYENEDNCPEYTEDKLLECTFEDGEYVEFTDGVASTDDKIAIACVPLTGTFLIKKKEPYGFVACMKIKDIITTPPLREDQLVFVTKPGGGNDSSFTSRNLQKITQRMMEPNTRVTLVPFVKDNNTIHDAIVIDGVVVGRFRCSYSIAGKGFNSKALTDMYLYKEGTVEQIIASTQPDSNGDIAIITLKDVKTVPCPTITGDWVQDYIRDIYVPKANDSDYIKRLHARYEKILAGSEFNESMFQLTPDPKDDIPEIDIVQGPGTIEPESKPQEEPKSYVEQLMSKLNIVEIEF